MDDRVSELISEKSARYGIRRVVRRWCSDLERLRCDLYDIVSSQTNPKRTVAHIERDLERLTVRVMSKSRGDEGTEGEQS